MGEILVRVHLEYLGVPYSVEANLQELRQMDTIGEVIDAVKRKIEEVHAQQESNSSDSENYEADQLEEKA